MIFFLFWLKTSVVGTRKEPPQWDGSNLCFSAKIRKNVNPCKPQFYYMKVGCKGVEIYPDGLPPSGKALLIHFTILDYCMQADPGLTRASGSFFHEKCILKGEQSLAKDCALYTGKLPPGGLPRNSVVKSLAVPT